MSVGIGLAVTATLALFRKLLNSPSETAEARLARLNNNIIQCLNFNRFVYNDSHRIAARTALSHLDDAINLQDTFLRKMAWDRANDAFVGFIHLPEFMIETEENRKYIAIGYLGRYKCLDLVGDKKRAMETVYQCAVKYPLVAASTFPNELFDGFDVAKYLRLRRDSNSLLANGCVCSDSPYADLQPYVARPMIKAELSETKTSFRKYAERRCEEIQKEGKLCWKY